jgi:predicted ATPase
LGEVDVIKQLRLRKILSFDDSEIKLGQLNVLIGANAVGKSNLIEVIGLLQAAPTNLTTAILRGGGVRQWLWMGDPGDVPVARIECELNLAHRRDSGVLVYELDFSGDAGGFVIQNERLIRRSGSSAKAVFFRRDGGILYIRIPGGAEQKTGVSTSESVLSQLKNPADTTPITQVGLDFSQIRIYREFRTSPGSPVRVGISTAARKDLLTEGGDNLALMLHELNFLDRHERIRGYLRRFCERFEDVKIDVGEGLARTFLREAGLGEMLPAIRMSDGTLKFLALLAALFHPKPPPLLCIEEPEVGLHPDAMHLVAEALVEASQSMQLIVTTHSDALIDALTDQPESVLVCERDFDNGTQMKRSRSSN